MSLNCKDCKCSVEDKTDKTFLNCTKHKMNIWSIQNFMDNIKEMSCFEPKDADALLEEGKRDLLNIIPYSKWNTTNINNRLVLISRIDERKLRIFKNGNWDSCNIIITPEIEQAIRKIQKSFGV